MHENITTVPSAGTARTVTATRDSRDISPASAGPVTLRLRGEPRQSRRAIRWAEDVVDNEGMGKKSSKGEFALCA